jgi:hypothetical protein
MFSGMYESLKGVALLVVCMGLLFRMKCDFDNWKKSSVQNINKLMNKSKNVEWMLVSYLKTNENIILIFGQVQLSGKFLIAPDKFVEISISFKNECVCMTSSTEQQLTKKHFFWNGKYRRLFTIKEENLISLIHHQNTIKKGPIIILENILKPDDVLTLDFVYGVRRKYDISSYSFEKTDLKTSNPFDIFYWETKEVINSYNERNTYNEVLE